MKMKRITAVLLSVLMCASQFCFAASADSTDESAGEQAESQKILMANAPDEPDQEVWTSEDFTYDYYSKLLYGCDYTRQIYINGQVITGFSEQGAAKLQAGSTDLVIPAKTPDGETITGIGNDAFNGAGLTSVRFPRGMIVPYDDTVTHVVTRRGNFIIHEGAFANNELTEVTLPAGVIACMANSFQKNRITRVSLPRTIWWIETLAFAENRITTVDFPQTCDFRMEMHGMSFAGNLINSVRLPDYTEVVNKHVFAMNPGMEPMTEEIAKKYSATDYWKYMEGGAAESGIVYMYTDREELFDAQRIHTLDRPTKNQWSPFQKLVLISDDTPDADTEKWNPADFTYDGTVVTGLSESGREKRKTRTDLIIPDRNTSGQFITEIADSDNFDGGLFGGAEDGSFEGFDSVSLPDHLSSIGVKAFAGLGLKEVVFPQGLRFIGMQAFANNKLEYIPIPDTVTAIGGGAFASNPTIREISLPVNDEYTVVEDGSFGCSDMNNWMPDFTSIEIPDNITKIGNNAFAGNNFETIEIPSSVREIGRYAFSTKNYLQTPTRLILNEGLETLGNRAFRNKKIASVVLPVSLKGLPALTFEKRDTDWDIEHGVNNPLVTKVFVTTEEQYNDRENFQESDHQKLYLNDPKKWTADDFVFEDMEVPGGAVVRAVAGFSEDGITKAGLNSRVTMPGKDASGNVVQAVAPYAFSASGEEGMAGCLSGTDIRITGLSFEGDTYSVIGDGAFTGNSLSELSLPEGITSTGGMAFADNELKKVTMPATLEDVGAGSFSRNRISILEFTEGGTGPLAIGDEAFSANRMKSLQISDNLDVLSGTAFADNPGLDTDEGIVYIYKATESGSSLAYRSNGGSTCQEMRFGEIPADLAPWGPRHFTFSGDTITGFSEDGELKVASDPYVILPGMSSDGTVITTVGGVGTVLEDGTTSNTGAFEGYCGNKGVPEEGYKSVIKGVEFAPSITTVRMKAFNTCAIEDIVIPDTITVIEPSAFASNFGTKTITLSEKMTEVPDGAFVTNATTMDMSTGVAELVIPEGVTRIGKNAFLGQHIKKLTLPSTLVEIDENAFQNHQITELDIPPSVRVIGRRAFEVRQDGAAPLPEVLTLHNGIEEIGPQAFGQTSLDYVCIPPSLVSVAEDAFVDWRGNGRADGEKVVLRSSDAAQAEGSGKYTGVVTEGRGHRVIYDKMVGTGWDYSDFTYSEDGTVITGWTEKGNEKRKAYAERPDYPAMVMPDRPSYDSDSVITEIGANAFRLELKSEDGTTGEVTMRKFDCDSPYGIQRMLFPEHLERIGDAAFEYNNLKAVDLDQAKDLSAIGMSAFHGNQLTTLSIPETVTELGEGAFAMNAIDELELPGSITVIPQGCFSMNIFLSYVEIPDTVTEIDDMAFAGARLQQLDIPASVTRIGRKAFHLHHLRSLYIPGNVKTIDESAFEGTFKDSTLISLMLGEGIEYIGKYAFKEALLEEVTLPHSLKEIGEDPFYSNKGKDGSRVVMLYTGNREHLKFNNDEYRGRENGQPTHYHEVIIDSDIYEPTEAEIAEREEALDELAEKIVDANAVLAEGKYSKASRDALSRAITAANALYDDPKALKSDVQAARAELMRALRNLEPVDQEASAAEDDRREAADTLARTLIDIYSTVSASSYRAASYKAFTKAVRKAEAVLEDPDSDAAELRQANTDVLKAWGKLVKKKSQPMKVSGKTVKVKAGAVRKKARKIGIRKAVTVRKQQGKLSYKKVGGNRKISVNRKTGRITVGKGLRRGTYAVKVRVTAAGNGNYRAGSKTVTFRVKIK